ncbi:polysaccharide biosynthesis/export family protein [Methylobacterium segetis]|uniref:polysaccharide biosynthesis/export family protein n=1 Tax=Methylobacterium segetis TaxID=2488750 RepID=UPI0010433CAC|nr:polysaccharide biosynthesis/export family protein [Methylobacterium segetis]
MGLHRPFDGRRAGSRGSWLLLIAGLLALLAAPARAAGDTVLRAGDRLKVMIFETMEVPEPPEVDKPRSGDATAVMQTVYPRVDLSGEYGVEPGGSVVLPLFGGIEAAGRTTAAFRADLGDAFDRMFHRRCNITVSILQRAPVYVVGAVRNPGSFAYVPGLMVLQAVALAGGDNQNGLPAQAIEASREQERRDAARDRLKQLLLRKAALVAERDGAPVAKAADGLRQLVGADGSASLIAGEQRMAQLRLQNLASARATRERAITATQDEIELLKQRMANFDAQIRVRGERLKMMEALFARQVVENERVADVRRDYVDMEGRRRDIEISLLQAEQRLETARKALVQADLERRLTLERDLATVESEADAAERAYHALAATATLMARSSPTAGREGGVLTFEIVRRTIETTDTLRAGELDALEPGDVLRVRLSPPETSRPATASVEKEAALGGAP